MILKRIIYVLVTFLAKSFGETCIPFIDHESTEYSDSIVEPGRVWRWNKKSGIIEQLEYLKPNQSALCSIDYTNSLEGKVLKIAVDELNPYVLLKNNNTEVTGFFGDVWTILQETLKFRSVFVPYNQYTVLKTGKYDVMLTASLVKVPANIFYTHSTVIGKNSYSLFALSEGTFISKWWYTSIFNDSVWLLSIICVVVLTLTMMGIHNFKKSCCKQDEYNDEFGSGTYNLLCILGATSGQGFQDIPRSWSLRLCALTALNMGMLLSCGFNSTLTSYLAFRAPYVTMSNLDDVWRQGTHSICVRKISLAYNELIGAIVTGHKPMAPKEKQKTKLLNKNCPNMENEIELRNNLCKPGFVYVEATDVFLKQYHYVQEKCQIVKMPGSYWNSKISFLHYRGSKYSRVINTYLLRLHSAGILKHLEAKWSFKQDLQHGVFSNFQAVELGHVELLITGLLIMTIVSIIICIIENCWYRYRSRFIQVDSLNNLEGKLFFTQAYGPVIIKRSAIKLKRLQREVSGFKIKM